MRSLAKLLLLLVLSCSACKRPETEVPACPVNQIRTNGNCECDERSVPYKGGCEYVGGLTKGLREEQGNVAVAVNSTCKDWKDSSVIFYTIKNYKNRPDSVESISLAIYSKSKTNTVGGWIKVASDNFFKIGDQYDTLKSVPSRFNDAVKINKWMNCYIRINKQRDSIFAKLCTTNPIGSLKYPDLDSCFVTFVKIY